MENEDIISLNKALSRINGLYQKWFQKKALNSYLLQTLNALYMEPELTQKEISEKYLLPVQTVNNAVRFLQNQGYLELIPNEHDKRAKNIMFTERGLNFARQTLEPLLRLEQETVKYLGQAKHRQFIKLLESYGDALEKASASGDK